MVVFVSLSEKVEALRALCVENTGSREIREISVDVPRPPLDELHFRKIVAWCYVLFHETGPFIDFSGRLLRARRSKSFGETRRLVVCARTVHTHNLASDNKRDVKMDRDFQIWLQENGGNPTNWEKCNQALMKKTIQVVSEIELEIKRISEVDSDRDQLWIDYQRERDNFWEGHEFDPFILQAAKELCIVGLDISAFRNQGDRLKNWRQIVGCFSSRIVAEEAIGRAIRTDLLNVFGEA